MPEIKEAAEEQTLRGITPCPKPAKTGTNTSNYTHPCQKCHFSGTGFLGLRTL